MKVTRSHMTSEDDSSPIEKVQSALDRVESGDSAVFILERAMNYYCSNSNICQGFKDAIMYAVRDQYHNCSNDDQAAGDLIELLKLLS